MEHKTKITIMMYVTSVLFSLVIAAVVFGIAALICGDLFGTYMKLVFIPFYAFFGGFVNNFFLRKCKGAALIPLIMCPVAYLLFVNVDWAVLGLFLLYAANWLIGVIIAFLVRSYKK